MEKIEMAQLVARIEKLEERNKELEQLILSIFRPMETYVTFSQVEK